jgi:hypothetical protein
MKKTAKQRKRVRIYYAIKPTPLWWMVIAKAAKQVVTLNGSLVDAIRGTPGHTIGCHLSNCAKRNQGAFPHPCLLAAFTRSTAYIITKIRAGKPVEAIKYRHSYGRLVDMNDRKVDNKFIHSHPELSERTFTLRPPRKGKQQGGGGDTGTSGYSKKAFVPVGAMRRALTAGLIDRGLVQMGFE